ncbi:MAG: hypothetical protein H3C30_19185, partial [Candidatus Hydrogenedentes bacterium]|nr:hypothetical protein [Candidatus Hydrogenedentota bacterium]
MSRRLPMIVLLLFLAMGNLASAAVPCPVGVNATTNQVRTAASPLTFTYSNNTGSNRLLVVTIGMGSTSNPGTAGTVSAVTYAGQAMTQAGTAFSTDGARVYIFTLSEYEGMPTSGTVSISYSSGSIVEAGATSFFNVNQDTPLGAFGSSSSSSNATANSPDISPAIFLA